MKEGTPTYEQMCMVIGSIYSDAYLRIQFLENENKKLRQDQHDNVASLQSLMDNLRKENARLQDLLKDRQLCSSGNGNSMLPESLQQRLNSELTGQNSILLDQQGEIVSGPLKSIEVPAETQNLTAP